MIRSNRIRPSTLTVTLDTQNTISNKDGVNRSRRVQYPTASINANRISKKESERGMYDAFYTWLGKQLEAEGEADVHGAARAVLTGRGVEEAQILRHTLTEISEHLLDAERRPTSAGRWVLSRLPDQAGPMLDAVRNKRMEGHLAELAPISQIVQQGERRLKVWFTKGAERPPLPAGHVDGMRVIQQDTESLEIAYQGSADAVLKWLARFDIDRLATPQTSLEDAFIHYYRKEADREQ